MITSLFNLNAQTVAVSSFGFSENPSRALRTAFSSENDTIIIDKQDNDWVINPMEFKGLKNKVVIIEPNVQLIAAPHMFQKKSDVLLKFIDCENMRIIGNGAELCMNKEEYTNGEWRHGISLRNCKDFVIENVHVKDTGGDGIYIAGTIEGSYCENIVIDKVISTNNRRQGLSIISGKNIQITNSCFQNTIGTLPGAGVDLEPNSKYDRLQNIVFENCIFKNNDHSGILVALGKLEKDSEPVSIVFEHCVLQNNHDVDNKYIASEIVFGAHKTNPVKGTVEFNNCLIENSKWGLCYSRKTNDAYHVSFKDCVARNICQDNSYPVIYLEVPDYRTGSFDMGGFTFNNLYLNYANDVPIFQVRGATLNTLASISNIKGTITTEIDKTKKIEYIKYDPSSNHNVSFNIQVKN